MRIHDDILREILNRSAHATPGPYFVTPQSICSDSHPRSGREKDDGYAGTLVAESMRESDRDFLVCCRPETIASMVREMQAMRLNLSRLRAVVGDADADLMKLAKAMLAGVDDDPIPF